MSRTTNIVLGSVFAIIACACAGDELYLLLMLSGAAALAFFGWWVYQKLRDDEFIAEAAREREAYLPEDPATVLVMQQTSQRLFVPSPLHEHNKEIKQ